MTLGMSVGALTCALVALPLGAARSYDTQVIVDPVALLQKAVFRPASKLEVEEQHEFEAGSAALKSLLETVESEVDHDGLPRFCRGEGCNAVRTRLSGLKARYTAVKSGLLESAAHRVRLHDELEAAESRRKASSTRFEKVADERLAIQRDMERFAKDRKTAEAELESFTKERQSLFQRLTVAMKEKRKDAEATLKQCSSERLELTDKIATVIADLGNSGEPSKANAQKTSASILQEAASRDENDNGKNKSPALGMMQTLADLTTGEALAAGHKQRLLSEVHSVSQQLETLDAKADAAIAILEQVGQQAAKAQEEEDALLKKAEQVAQRLDRLDSEERGMLRRLASAERMGLGAISVFEGADQKAHDAHSSTWTGYDNEENARLGLLQETVKDADEAAKLLEIMVEGHGLLQQEAATSAEMAQRHIETADKNKDNAAAAAAYRDHAAAAQMAEAQERAKDKAETKLRAARLAHKEAQKAMKLALKKRSELDEWLKGSMQRRAAARNKLRSSIIHDSDYKMKVEACHRTRGEARDHLREVMRNKKEMSEKLRQGRDAASHPKLIQAGIKEMRSLDVAWDGALRALKSANQEFEGFVALQKSADQSMEEARSELQQRKQEEEAMVVKLRAEDEKDERALHTFNELLAHHTDKVTKLLQWLGSTKSDMEEPEEHQASLLQNFAALNAFGRSEDVSVGA